jgi:uncharacterized protein YbaR (Trm112 family)
MNAQLLKLLACPICKGPLQLRREATELVCQTDRLVYVIHDGVPILLSAQGRPLTSDGPDAPTNPDRTEH